MNAETLETTLYSLSTAAPAQADRRDGERHLTLYRVGSLMLGDRRELCLIKNISAGGMMVRVYCEVVEGSRVTIELKSGESISGVATWYRAPNVGIAFDQPIDVVSILKSCSEGPRPRLPRIEVNCLALVREGARVHRLRSLDISQGGIKVEGRDLIEPRTEVVVSLAGLGPIPATVSWREHGQMGLKFNRHLTLAGLIDWLQSRREIEHAAGGFSRRGSSAGA